MIIVGAGSAGKETSGILMQSSSEEIVFFDENVLSELLIWDKFLVINSLEELKKIVAKAPSFCVAIGNPRKREKMYNLMLKIGGIPKNILANNTSFLSNPIKNGSIFQSGVCISYEVSIGKSCLLHANSVIGHKTIIGDFVNISPLCSIIGPCTIGNNTYIGASTTILPNLKIGNNVYVPAGSLVNRNLKDYETFEK